MIHWLSHGNLFHISVRISITQNCRHTPNLRPDTLIPGSMRKHVEPLGTIPSNATIGVWSYLPKEVRVSTWQFICDVKHLSWEAIVPQNTTCRQSHISWDVLHALFHYHAIFCYHSVWLLIQSKCYEQCTSVPGICNIYICINYEYIHIRCVSHNDTLNSKLDTVIVTKQISSSYFCQATGDELIFGWSIN